jgi:hypothetical protein
MTEKTWSEMQATVRAIIEREEAWNHIGYSYINYWLGNKPTLHFRKNGQLDRRHNISRLVHDLAKAMDEDFTKEGTS